MSTGGSGGKIRYNTRIIVKREILEVSTIFMDDNIRSVSLYHFLALICELTPSAMYLNATPIAPLHRRAWTEANPPSCSLKKQNHLLSAIHSQARLCFDNGD